MAIDKHLIPRHGRNDMSHLIRSKPKGDTGKFECYTTMYMMAERVPAILECMQVMRNVDNTGFGEKGNIHGNVLGVMIQQATTNQ